jgi:hypothetical protein
MSRPHIINDLDPDLDPIRVGLVFDMDWYDADGYKWMGEYLSDELKIGYPGDGP